MPKLSRSSDSLPPDGPMNEIIVNQINKKSITVHRLAHKYNFKGNWDAFSKDIKNIIKKYSDLATTLSNQLKYTLQKRKTQKILNF